MVAVSIHEAKAHLSRLIASVEAGEEVTILRGKKPVARLMPVLAAQASRSPGRLKGQIMMDGFFDPLQEDDLSLWECNSV